MNPAPMPDVTDVTDFCRNLLYAIPPPPCFPNSLNRGGGVYRGDKCEKSVKSVTSVIYAAKCDWASVISVICVVAALPQAVDTGGNPLSTARPGRLTAQS